MKYLFSFLFLISFAGISQTKPGKINGEKVLLSNGWSLTPAGQSLPLGGLPFNMSVSLSKGFIAVTNNG